MEKLKEDVKKFLDTYTCVEDRERFVNVLRGGEKYSGVTLECLQCPHKFFTIQEFKKKEATCPKCGTKLIIRSYKNGSVTINRVKE